MFEQEVVWEETELPGLNMQFFAFFLLFCFVFLLWFYKMFELEAVWEETELLRLNMQFF